MPIMSFLHRYDGLILSVGGNGRSYVAILETGPLAGTSQSKLYFARMTTKVGFCRVSSVCNNFKILADFTACWQSKNIESDLISFCYLFYAGEGTFFGFSASKTRRSSPRSFSCAYLNH